VPGKPPPQRWFNAEYRVYNAATASIRSLTVEELVKSRERIDAVARTLAAPDDAFGDDEWGTGGELAPGEEFAFTFEEGSHALETVELTLDPADEDENGKENGGENPGRDALRTLILKVSFDGETTVWCPASEFFGCGPKLVPFTDWRRTVRADGHLFARFPMPYRKTASLSIRNVGRAAVALQLTAYGRPFDFDERALHFHATWHADLHLKTRPFRDFDFVTVKGTGVYVGDTLSVFNPVRAWWGEGDEKVFVDGESFPSHFGTGSEDHYGFAWGANRPFATPFCAQPRVDGPGNLGFTTVTRTRVLDTIPFTQSLEYDLEVWHWADCEVSYCAGAFWYALPGATSNRVAQEDAAAAALPGVGIPGALEAERLKIVARRDGLPVETQTDVALPAGRWSEDAQLFVKGRQLGDFVRLELPAPAADRHKLRIHLTKSYDYGILRFTLGDRVLGRDYDAYAATSDLATVDFDVTPPATAKPEAVVLEILVVGKNPAAKGSGCFFGIDALEWVP